MDFVKKLTPKDTEEMKSGLFIQRWRGGWRQVHPAAWNGKINYKNLIFGGSILKPLVVLALIILLTTSYYSDTHACSDFQADPCKYLPNLTQYCMDVSVEELDLDFEVINDGKQFTNSDPLQGYP